MTVGSVPNTAGLASTRSASRLDRAGFVEVDRVSRTTRAGIYAAGDVTGVFMLASVAAMQGRIAMWHALGEAVTPLRLKTVSANVFTHPEIATVGIQEKAITAGEVPADGPDAAGDQRAGQDAAACARASSSCSAGRRPAWSSAASWSRRRPPS